MKQYTVRLEKEQVAQLERVMEMFNKKNAQQAFEWMVETYRSLHDACEYWEKQHDDLSAEYYRLTEKTDEKIALLRSIIEEGLGKKVI